jgi:hypothetical protein
MASKESKMGEEVGAGGRNDPSLYAHMNNKIIKKRE